MDPNDLMYPPSDDDAMAIRARSDVLRRLGFQMTKVIDPSTAREAWMWAKVWRGVREAVIAHREGALAYRMHDVGYDPADPFKTPDLHTEWQAVGNFLSVSTQLLELDAPAQWCAHSPSASKA